ncbi:hypothetical protein DFO73_13210 [Cytobacillus oceanisediminis]|uniref:Uncharacterized protein n=1 Tax=Cytobacillus oceanisediminis TaxID=665099 RepID=A0A2V2ZFR8_9BACI|nr:hypothetical protein [Cytobacillus oceanisediminis]PWW17080.1 hypothetical protein DFO73_13210 [Cytobacillus oceanisediminis]
MQFHVDDSPIKANLIKDLAFLTSKETGGRLSGSPRAKLAAQYLAKELSALGAKPAGEDGYFSRFDIFAARLKGEVVLRVGERKLRHRIDYGEVSRYSHPDGSKLKGNLIVVKDRDEVAQEDLKSKVVLIQSERHPYSRRQLRKYFLGTSRNSFWNSP